MNNFDRKKWWGVFSKLIDVLKINIFMVNSDGKVVLPPDSGKYGGKFLFDAELGFNLCLGSPDFLSHFSQTGIFYKANGDYGLKFFMLPIDDQKNEYIVVGPVFLDQRLNISDYDEMIQKKNLPEIFQRIVSSELNQIRVVSNLMMNSILELALEIISNQEHDPQILNEKNKTAILSNLLDEIYSDVRINEALVKLLDVSLKMSNAECGSIMVLDSTNSNELVMKVSKGLSKEFADNVRIKIGNGITGLAVQNDECFVIQSDQKNQNNRINHLLERPEIKESVIMPIRLQNQVVGALNLHTKQEQNFISKQLSNVQYLSQMMEALIDTH